MEILGGFELVRDSANASCMISGWVKDAETVSAVRMYSIWEKAMLCWLYRLWHRLDSAELG